MAAEITSRVAGGYSERLTLRLDDGSLITQSRKVNGSEVRDKVASVPSSGRPD